MLPSGCLCNYDMLVEDKTDQACNIGLACMVIHVGATMECQPAEQGGELAGMQPVSRWKSLSSNVMHSAGENCTYTKCNDHIAWVIGQA